MTTTTTILLAYFNTVGIRESIELFGDDIAYESFKSTFDTLFQVPSDRVIELSSQMMQTKSTRLKYLKSMSAQNRHFERVL